MYPSCRGLYTWAGLVRPSRVPRLRKTGTAAQRLV